MLKKVFRLPLGIQQAFTKTHAAHPFVVKIAKSDKMYPRFGFVVSKRVDKRAVVRNSIKRRVRACVEEKLNAFPKGFDFLFILKKSVYAATHETICQHIDQVLSKDFKK